MERRLPKRGPGTAALASLLGCASCGAQMERGRFAASSGVVVDVCTRHGVWLDHGELARVAEYARSPARLVEAPVAHPVVSAVEAEHRRIGALAARASRRAPPRPLWLKVLPLVLVAVGVFARYYYLQKVAARHGVDIPNQGEDVRRAGEETHRALGGN